MLKVLDLFSGIGGFSLGLESTGHFKTIAFVEKDKFCQKVLQKNFKNIPIEGDIRNVKGEKYKADVVTGGFPCQPFSVAGKRKGTDDDRYLWDETIRVVRECKPKYFIGENVEGLINIQQGMVLRQVQTDLEKEGFEVQCLIIPASGIGAWHQRKRVWIVGYSEHNGHTSTKIKGSSNKTNDDCKKRKHQTIESERTSRYRNNENVWMDVSNSNARFGIGENKEIQTRGNSINNGSSTDVPNSKSKWSRECRELDKKKRLEESKSTQSDCICSDVPNSDSRMRRRWGTIGESGANKIWEFYSEKEKQSEQNFRSKTIGCDDIFREKQNLQYTNNKRCKESDLSTKSKKSDFGNREYDSTRENKTWWQTQSNLCGVPDGVSYELDKDRANRIKALGNSIVPQIVRELGLAIIEAENDR
jgi:DNA-cytosine methyltransferase